MAHLAYEGSVLSQYHTSGQLPFMPAEMMPPHSPIMFTAALLTAGDFFANILAKLSG